ncbi:phage tail protein [Pseudomonas sp. AA27]|uniref:phage tail protein n=1 Tax=Pseudomonas sp. AA27 TaxID=2908652 RepID=UPI001F401953|nr:phage tail protein [Pseudomonas sp. AA27]MCF1486214.1 phage tail protein [Pseudomonas sp. AA27]
MARITFAGESLIAQKQGAKEVLQITRFIYANVPGLDPNTPIDRAATKPPASQIVHSYDIPAGNSGYVNPNQVVYSSMLGSDIGDFDWNWMGLESAEGVLFAVAYLPLQQKRRNIPPLQIGNNVTRNILVEYSGAQELTGITIDASTWQHDFTVRLKGIDERERLSNRDVYGRACFFGDGLGVVKSGTGYQLATGLAYLEGIRIELARPLPLPQAKTPSQVWLHVSLHRERNDVVPSWTVVFEPDQLDYLKNDSWVYCIPLADISASGTITDRRRSFPINTPLVEHFAAKTGYYNGMRVGSADKLQFPRKINGIPFDGSTDITVGDTTKLPLTGGNMSGTISFENQQMGGFFVDWATRVPALQLNCPANVHAYSLWKASNLGERHLAALDVWAGGTTQSQPSVVMHVGTTTNAFTFDGTGSLTIKGSYGGDAGSLTGLNANQLSKGYVPAERLTGTYTIDIAGVAAKAVKLSVPRKINGVSFDGSSDITVVDASKLPLAGGTVTGPITFTSPGMGGAFVDWRQRTPAVQINSPEDGGAYLLWRATNWGVRHLAAMEAFSGGGPTTPAQVVTHVGATNNAMTVVEGGHLWISGTYHGDASGLTNLPQATPSLPGAVQKNTASLGQNGWWRCAQTGLIKQWGLTQGASDMTTHRSFPIAFPNRCVSLVASRTSLFYADANTGTNTLIVSNSQFSVISGPFNSPDDIYWEATGY